MSPRLRANVRHLAVPALLDGVVLAVFAGVMLTAGGATLDAAAIASLFFGGTVVAIAGSVIVAWTMGDAYPSHHVMAILLGSLATSLVLLLACLITGTLAAKVFVAWSAVVLVTGAWTLRSVPPVERRDGLDLLAIVAIAILVAAWCRDAASTLPSIQATGIVPIWSDYSIHAAEIAQFGDPHVHGLSSFLLAGQPLVFYHYAPYMLPAAAAGVMSLPPWGVAASLLLPYGILLMSLGAYAFVRLQLGAAAATIAPAALLLVPDGSAYGLRNGFFGFHWLLFTAPGSGYGLGAAFTALTCFVVWRSTGRRACFWLGIVATAAVFEFRAQIFLLLAPALATSLLCETSFVRRRARAVILTAALDGRRRHRLRGDVARRARRLAAILRLAPVSRCGALADVADGLRRCLRGHRAAFRTACRDDARRDRTHSGCARCVGARAASGLRRSGTPHRLACPRPFPFWCIAAWLGVVLFAPMASYGDYTEFQQRPFVLNYASAVVWTLLFVERGLPAAGPSAAASPPRTLHDAGRGDRD